MPINVFSRYILYLASSNSLSSLLFSELPDIIPQIEKEIENNTNEKGLDEEDEKIKINNKIKNIYIYK